MLVIAHYIAKSSIHGLGAFAAEAISHGSVIWKFDPTLDREIHESELARFPGHVRAWITSRAQFFPKERVFVLAADGDLFMNHSDNPNMSNDGHECFATRDIAIGDELTCDYRVTKVLDFDPFFDSISGEEKVVARP